MAFFMILLLIFLNFVYFDVLFSYSVQMFLFCTDLRYISHSFFIPIRRSAFYIYTCTRRIIHRIPNM